MPRRTTRTSQASGSSEAPLVLSGDEDGVAPPRRLPREDSDRLRDMELTFKLRMYDYAVGYLRRTLTYAAPASTTLGFSACLSIFSTRLVGWLGLTQIRKRSCHNNNKIARQKVVTNKLD